MTFKFFQPPNGIEFTANPATMTTKWRSVGNADPNYVYNYAMGATPAIVATPVGTLYRQDLRVNKVAFNHFEISVPYGTRQNASGEWTWDFDTTGGTVHITHAKEELRRYPTATAPNQKGAIAVDKDEVKGVEIVIPSMTMSVAYKHPLGVLTIPYAKYLRSLTGKVNSAPMLGHAAGEVLFLGARGADGTVAEAACSYFFAMSENASGLSFGDVANVVKRGHEVAWIRYKDSTDTVGGTVRSVRIPEFAYVDRVYDEVNLATALGFGG